jgi:hypothetical protein
MRLIRQLTWMWAVVLGICLEAPGQTVFVDPGEKIVTDTSPFTLSVKINNVTRLHGVTIEFSFDATMLTCTAVSPGGFLPSVMAFGPYPSLAAGVGYYTYDQAISGSSVVSGSGVLLTLTFQGVKPGLSPVTLAKVTLRGDPDNIHPTNPNDPIACTTTNGQVILETTVPITLSSFTASTARTGNNVLLDWTTLSEINNYGFWIQRRAVGEEAFVDIENSFTPGHGTTIQPRQYSFADVSVPASGEYEYRLRQVDLDGTDHLSNSVRVSVVLTSIAERAPIMFALDQNYPNPFNPETAIRFSVDKSGQAELTVFNTLGELIETLYSGYAEMGRYYDVRFNAARRASGVYFYRLSTSARADFRRMLLLK